MKSKLYALGMLALLAALMSVRGEMSGESGRSSRFVGKLDPAASYTNQCEFSVEIERVMFKLNSLKDKYKLVRIRVENRMGGPIKLSGDEDAIELQRLEVRVNLLNESEVEIVGFPTGKRETLFCRSYQVNGQAINRLRS